MFFVGVFFKVSIEIDGVFADRAKNSTNNLPLVIFLITWHMDARPAGWCAKHGKKIKNNFLLDRPLCVLFETDKQ